MRAAGVAMAVDRLPVPGRPPDRSRAVAVTRNRRLELVAAVASSAATCSPRRRDTRLAGVALDAARIRRTRRQARLRPPSGSDCAQARGAGCPTESGIRGLPPAGSNHDGDRLRSFGPPARSSSPRLDPAAVEADPGAERARRRTRACSTRRSAASLRSRRFLGRLQPRVQVALQERLPQRREQVAVDPLRVAEPDLDLGRVDVDVDLLGRDLQVEERHRHPADHQQAAIRLVERVAERAVADVAAAEEEELPLGGRPALRRVRRRSPRDACRRAGPRPRAATRPARGRRRPRSARACPGPAAGRGRACPPSDTSGGPPDAPARSARTSPRRGRPRSCPT